MAPCCGIACSAPVASVIILAMRIGVISDTHGYLHPGVYSIFGGVDLILHAGDVGSEDVLSQLASIAPLQAVHGNNDVKHADFGLPQHLDLSCAGIEVHLVHELPLARPASSTRLVVYGHSHRCDWRQRGDLWLLNPGAAGKTGFHRVQTCALLDIEAGVMKVEIVELARRGAGV